MKKKVPMTADKWADKIFQDFIKERTTMKKRVLMTDERAYKIIQDFLDVLSVTISCFGGLENSECVENPDLGTVFRHNILRSNLTLEGLKNYLSAGNKLTISSRGEIKNEFVATVHAYCEVADNKIEYITKNEYDIFVKGRHFIIEVFNTAEDFGYYSLLPDYDPDTYVCVGIRELYSTDYFSDDVKYSVILSFDIEKMIFLELFEIELINDVCRKEPKDIDRIEEYFKNRSIPYFDSII